MVQAARSGKQNIVEGCAARTTSTETELKLLNVAKASLQELLVDYEDYLRVRKLTLWGKDDNRYINLLMFAVLTTALNIIPIYYKIAVMK